MTPEQLNILAIILGIVGLACFGWPILQRVSGKAPAEPVGSGRSLRSPLWWAGFVLTIAAIALQRYAVQAAG